MNQRGLSTCRAEMENARRINKLVKNIVTSFGKISHLWEMTFPCENHLFIEVIKTNWIYQCKTMRINIKNSEYCISKFSRVSIGDILLKRKIALQGGLKKRRSVGDIRSGGRKGGNECRGLRNEEGYAEKRTRVAKERTGGGRRKARTDYCAERIRYCARMRFQKGGSLVARRPPGSPSEGGWRRGGAKRARDGKGESGGHTWATTARPSLTPTKENRYAWFMHARACEEGWRGTSGALLLGEQNDGERERGAKRKSYDGGRRTRGVGEGERTTLSVAAHFSRPPRVLETKWGDEPPGVRQ